MERTGTSEPRDRTVGGTSDQRRARPPAKAGGPFSWMIALGRRLHSSDMAPSTIPTRGDEQRAMSALQRTAHQALSELRRFAWELRRLETMVARIARPARRRPAVRRSVAAKAPAEKRAD